MSAIVFVVTMDFVSDRLKKKKELSKHSQPSDIFFVVWLFLMGFTAFLVRLFIDLDILYGNDLVIISILPCWFSGIIVVPFGKSNTSCITTLAMYFAKLKE